jgi:hypothetical protein
VGQATRHEPPTTNELRSTFSVGKGQSGLVTSQISVDDLVAFLQHRVMVMPNKGETMRRVSFLVISLLLSGCVTGERVRGTIQEGMSKEQVISELGNPDGFKRSGEYEALLYTNRLISGWSWDRTDYTIILQNGRVSEYGSGQVRQNSPNTLILVPLR